MTSMYWLLVLAVLFAGVQQDNAADGDCPLDLVFVVDRSGSICKNASDVTKDEKGCVTWCDHWKMMQDFMIDVIEEMEYGPNDIRVSVVIFGNKGHLIWNLDGKDDRGNVIVEDAEDLIAEIENLQYKEENTNISGGFWIVYDQVFDPTGGDREDVPNVVILLTDGRATRDRNLTLPYADALKKDKKATMFAVGVITSDLDIKELKKISSSPHKLDENYFLSPDFDDLDDIPDLLVAQACQACHAVMDLVFIVDHSGSICDIDPTKTKDSNGKTTCDNWKHIISAITSVVEHLTIGPLDVRVGMVTFGGHGNFIWNLARYDDEDDLLEAIAALTYNGGTTNTAEALEVVYDQVFDNEGDREDVVNIVIMVTDGGSSPQYDDPVPAANDLKEDKDATIYVVGIQTKDLSVAQLQGMSSDPQLEGENYYISDDFEAVVSSLDEALDQACEEYDDEIIDPEPECVPRLDLLFIVDSTDSICGNSNGCDNWDMMLDFVSSIVDPMVVDSDAVQVAMILFGDEAYLMWGLERYNDYVEPKEELYAGIENLDYKGDSHTNTSGALWVALCEVFVRVRGDRYEVPNVIVLLTSSRSDVDEELTIPYAEALERDRMATFITVGITDNIDEEELEEIASRSQNFFPVSMVSDFDKLEELENTVADRACEVEFELKEDKECNDPLDLVFLLDRSGSICADTDDNVVYKDDHDCVIGCKNWDAMLTFITRVIQQFDIGSDDVRVGLVIFGNKGDLAWDLRGHDNLYDLAVNINNIPYAEQNTNISGGLWIAKTKVFHESKGDRDGVPDVIVIITDGSPHKDVALTLPYADELKDQGVTIFAVAVLTPELDVDAIEEISSYPHKENENYFVSLSFDGLQGIVDTLVEEACDSALVPDGIPECDAVLDVVFIVDNSGSICDSDDSKKEENGQVTCDSWKQILSLVTDAVDDMDIGPNEVRVAMVVFGNAGHLIWNLDTYDNEDDLKEAIGDIEFRSENTNTSGGMWIAYDQVFGSTGDRDNVPNVVIIITDGASTYDKDLTIPNADALKEDKGATIFVVGIVTDDLDEDELQDMSSPPQEEDKNYFLADDIEHLEDILELVVEQTCELVEEQPVECDKPLDVVLLVDSSGSICKKDPDVVKDANGWVTGCGNWDLMQEFMMKLVGQLDIGPDEAQVAMVTFANRGTLRWDLRGFNYTNTAVSQNIDEDVLLESIDELPYKGGNTNTSGGLWIAYDDVFDSDFGDRDDVSNIVILITDGRPTRDVSLTTPYIKDLEDDKDVTVFSVGVITPDLDEEELADMSSLPRELDETYFMAYHFDELPGIVNKIVENACELA